MKKIFRNSSQVQCVFTDEGVSFCGKEQEVYCPYGCLDSIKMSFLGVLQAVSGAKICSFAADRKDRAEVKEMVKFAQKAMAGAPKAEIETIDLTRKAEAESMPEGTSSEALLKHYKEQFIQGMMTKSEYEAKKRTLKE